MPTRRRRLPRRVLISLEETQQGTPVPYLHLQWGMALDEQRSEGSGFRWLPVAPGRLTLLIPGEHGPGGDVTQLASLVVRAGERRLAWQRNAVEIEALHVEVPSSVRVLEIDFEHLFAVRRRRRAARDQRRPAEPAPHGDGRPPRRAALPETRADRRRARPAAGDPGAAGRIDTTMSAGCLIVGSRTPLSKK